MEDYFYQNYYVQAYEDFESMYYHLMDHAKDREVKKTLTDWFFKVKSKRREVGGFKLDRHFVANVSSLGPAFFAERIKAKGPNTMVSGACASTTQAISTGEDWIRSGRCDRVIIIGGEDTTSGVQNQWIGSGFLATHWTAHAMSRSLLSGSWRNDLTTALQAWSASESSAVWDET